MAKKFKLKWTVRTVDTHECIVDADDARSVAAEFHQRKDKTGDKTKISSKQLLGKIVVKEVKRMTRKPRKTK